MLVNSSTSTNFLFDQHVFIFKPYNSCLMNGTTTSVIAVFNVTNIILLFPLCTFILYHGGKEWLKRRSTSSALTLSHSDCFTYHMVTIELIGIVGCFISLSGTYSDASQQIKTGSNVYSFTWYGQIFVHNLTCMERYLAVVHPITYLSLRNNRGIRYRNINIGCVWLLCCLAVIIEFMGTFIILDLFLLISSIIIISFCSLSVLRVLIHPGPGEQGKDRDRVDQSKQRAFFTILIILGVLSVRCVFGVIWAVLSLWKDSNDCFLLYCNALLILPSSLVLPLLLLHRAEKLVCCKKPMQQR